MHDANSAYRWLEGGKQIGRNFTYTKGDNLYYASVAIQKCGGVYRLYYSEIEESHIAAHEDYLLEEVLDVQHFDQLLLLVPQRTCFQLDDLTPLKAQKIFNPDFH